MDPKNKISFVLPTYNDAGHCAHKPYIVVTPNVRQADTFYLKMWNISMTIRKKKKNSIMSYTKSGQRWTLIAKPTSMSIKIK